METLLKHGANPTVESKFDKTPLEIASENGRPDIFEILQVNIKLNMDLQLIRSIPFLEMD